MRAGRTAVHRETSSSQPGRADIHRLGATLLMGRDASQRAGAAQRLGRQGFVSAYAYLRHALWDPAETVRASAVEASATGTGSRADLLILGALTLTALALCPWASAAALRLALE